MLTLPSGKMTKIIHKDTYDVCGSMYEKIFAWIEKKGKTLLARSI
jgi:effector-binding domain-containing protein